MTNELEIFMPNHEIAMDLSNKAEGTWHQKYADLLGAPWEEDPTKYGVARNNPYYAAINATAFILKRGGFRGYRHLEETFFIKGSPHFVGLRIHKERTRTSWSDGRYVTDWYIADGLRNFELIFRATYAMLMVSEFYGTPDQRSLKRFTLANDLSIRNADNADQAPQITSG